MTADDERALRVCPSCGATERGKFCAACGEQFLRSDDFDLRRFRHEARYDEAERRIEMHLRSEIDQTVTIRAADFQFTLRAGETIWTESSHKFGLAEVQRVARSTGFVCVEQWVDPEWPFAENLLTVGSP